MNPKTALEAMKDAEIRLDEQWELVKELEMLKDARIGDRVYCLKHGWGVITHVGDPQKTDYPITVGFESAVGGTYTLGGLDYVLDLHPVLFWGVPNIIAPPPPARYKNVCGFRVPDIHYAGDGPVVVPCITSEMLCEVWRDCTNTPGAWVGADIFYPATPEGRSAAIAHASAWLGKGDPWEDEL